MVTVPPKEYLFLLVPTLNGLNETTFTLKHFLYYQTTNTHLKFFKQYTVGLFKIL